ncbi:COGs COG0226 [methanotrophic endosymbiont of Bathymodiolus puteoserpentis (Logatchev)]|nr:COGs COG0226 [methanotrophic endosymbiont of Bathymodiolus puteoserpentis (Logatchev)]
MHFINKNTAQKQQRKSMILLCIVLLLNAGVLNAAEVIVSANVVGQLKDTHKLQAIFSLRTLYWPNGEKIKVFVLPDNSAVHKEFVKEKLGMFPHQLRRTWNRMTYTGTGQPPITVDSVAEMLDKIQHTDNAIGYIDRRVEDESIHYFNAP